MKIVVIKENVMVPNCPSFKKGQEVRINSDLAKMLVDRGHAKYVKVDNARKETKELKVDQEKEKKEKK